MDVSIIIINYNTFDLTLNCVKSIHDHTESLEYEVIVVDNDSKDRPIDDLLSFYPGIRLVKNSKNLGFSAANNVGLSVSKGRYILLLNSDTQLCNNAIYSAIQKIEKKSQLAVSTVKVVYPDNRLQHVCGKFPSILGNLLLLFRMDKFLSKKQKENMFLGNYFDHQRARTVDWVWGTFFLIKRSVIDASFPAGKLHDNFFMYVEDIQWCYHVKKSGYEIIYDPEGKIIHYMGGSDASGQSLQAKYFKTILPNLYEFL